MDHQEKIHLSRLDIVKEISIHTPLCVLEEIIHAHGIKTKSKDPAVLCSKIHLFENKIVSVPKLSIGDRTQDDLIHLQYIARFVNKSVIWSKAKLMEALDFLLLFMQDELTNPLYLLPEKFECGQQTQENTISCNACVLYAICNYYHIETTFDTTMEYMKSAILLLRTNTNNIVDQLYKLITVDTPKHSLIDTFLKLNKGDITPLVSSKEVVEIHNHQQDPQTLIYQKHPKKPFVSYEQIGRLFHPLHEVSILQKNITPSTNEAAISLAAILYHMNISYTENPIKEYQVLKQSSLGLYVPNDIWFSYWLFHQPDIFSTLHHFQPILPIEFYSIKDMKQLLKRNGIKAEKGSNKEENYSLLQLLYITDTFYENEMPFMKKKETIITGTSIHAIPNGELFCYGSMETSFLPITLDELKDSFSFHKYFYNPFSPQSYNDVLSYTSIQKLKFLLSTKNKPSARYQKRYSKDTKEKRKELFDLILLFESQLLAKDEYTEHLLDLLKNEPSEIKEKINYTFALLMDIGLYMRGYEGKENETLPIKYAEIKNGEEHLVAFRTTRGIQAFETSCIELKEYGEYILKLPLVIYKNNTYYKSINPSEGLTIKDRLDIIKRGTDTENMASCIRLSSNWICSSAVKYMNAFGVSHSIRINELTYIY